VTFMKASHGGILDTITSAGEIDETTDKSMKEIFSKFTADFSA